MTSMNARQATSIVVMAPLAIKFLIIDREVKVAHCADISRQDRIRGNYENKIRFYSPPEKIFQTFASVKTENNKLAMTYLDFFRALTPYNYTGFRDNKDYFEKYSPDILKVADANGDGVISFTEFFFFVTILQMPESLFEKEIEKHNPEGKTLTKDQFSQSLTLLRKNT